MDKLKEYFPLISALLLILGTVRIIVFYSFFGIDITTYIDLSEIFTLSLSFFISSAIFLILTILIVLIMASYDLKGNNTLSVDYTDMSLLNSPRRNMIAIAYYILTFSVIIASGVLFVYGPSRQRITYDFALVAIPMALLVPPLLPSWHNAIARKYKNLFEKELESKFIFIFTVLVLMAMLSTLYTRTTARKVLYSEDLVQMTYNNKIIKTDSTYKYIGKTKNYIFFYNTTTKAADTYSASEVKFISSKEK